MAQSKYKNVRSVIAGMVCKEDFATIDAAMKQMGDCKLAVGTEDPVYGKYMSEFQKDIVINNDALEVNGTLYHISGWTAFSGIEEQQHGYYVHVKADTTLDDDLYDIIINNVKVNGEGNPDRNIVLWISEAQSQATGKKVPKVILKVVNKETGEVVKEETYKIKPTYVPENEEPSA